MKIKGRHVSQFIDKFDRNSPGEARAAQLNGWYQPASLTGAIEGRSVIRLDDKVHPEFWIEVSLEDAEIEAMYHAMKASKTMNAPTKPPVTLSGQDGNAYEIIGACKQAAREADMPLERWEEIRAEMMAGDYDNVIQVAMRHFDVS